MPSPKIVICLLAPLIVAAEAQPPANVEYSDYSLAFDQIEARTRNMPADQRVAEFRKAFGRIRPGLYVDNDPLLLDRRILRSLEEYPRLRPVYLQVQQHFRANLSEAVGNFRRIFPEFSSPLPIILTHELGMRDGGSDYVAGHQVMLFGTDVIAKLHNDDSLQPFLEHELFHLEHARHFADCDQFWCPLWQEGLATYAASLMTPHADDHQLLLDLPEPVRAPTEDHWREALCTVSAEFDEADESAMRLAFSGGSDASSALPARYGYYVGLKIAAKAGKRLSLPELAGLDNEHARPAVAEALQALIVEAQAHCDSPAQSKP